MLHALTRRAFRVSFEWRRLLQLAAVMGGLAVAGDLLLPTHGAVGLVTRLAAFAAIPLLLWLTGFAHPQELGRAREAIERAIRRGPAGEPA